MVVEFKLGRAKAVTVVSVRWKGPWQERRIRSEFEGLAKWAKARKLRTGRWFFLEPGARRWEVAIEVRGKVRGEGRVQRRAWPASAVAWVEFDPDAVTPQIVYHGLNDWLRWRRKDKTIKRAGTYREAYNGNPWTDRRAWSHTRVEVLVRR